MHRTSRSTTARCRNGQRTPLCPWNAVEPTRAAGMLSYLHGYHAGNHADVLKHVVLAAILGRLTQKDKPLRYIDTHSGSGGYDLNSAAARRNREHAGGIGKIWDATDAPPAVTRLLELVRAYNADGELGRYPGS